jgi:hypothetical protein
MNDYPIFKNGIAYIDHTILVDNETAKAWKENGITKIKTLSRGTDHVSTTILPCENWDGTIDSTAQWCIKKMLDWAYSFEEPKEIASLEVLTIGFGKIGGKLSEWLPPCCDTIDIDWYSNEKEYLEALKPRVQRADIIFLTINPEKNEWFWNKEKLDWMKPNTILISPSRPSVFSGAALSDSRIIWDKKHEAWITETVLKRKKEETE